MKTYKILLSRDYSTPYKTVDGKKKRRRHKEEIEEEIEAPTLEHAIEIAKIRHVNRRYTDKIELLSADKVLG